MRRKGGYCAEWVKDMGFDRFINDMPEPLMEGMQCCRWPRIKKDLKDIIKEPVKAETDKYYEGSVEEYYAVVTVCKKCQTEFIAFDGNHDYVNNYCPGCGEKLK